MMPVAAGCSSSRAGVVGAALSKNGQRTARVQSDAERMFVFKIVKFRRERLLIAVELGFGYWCRVPGICYRPAFFFQNLGLFAVRNYLL